MIAYEDDLIIRDITVLTTQNVDSLVWTVDVKVFCDRPKSAIGSNNTVDKMNISLSLKEDELKTEEFDVVVTANSVQREVVFQGKLEVPHVIIDQVNYRNESMLINIIYE